MHKMMTVTQVTVIVQMKIDDVEFSNEIGLCFFFPFLSKLFLVSRKIKKE